MAHVTVGICYNCRLYWVSLFISEISFSEWIVYVRQDGHVSLVPPHHSFQVTLGHHSNIIPFQSLYCGFQILGHSLSLWSHSPTTRYCFPGQVIKQVRGVKEVVHAVCNQLPLLPSSYLSLYHELLSGVVSSAVCPYQGTHPCHMYNQWSHTVCIFSCQKFAFFFFP